MKDIIVGNKNLDTYIGLGLRALKTENEITIRGRGRHISDAVTVAQIIRQDGYHIKDVDIYTDDVEIEVKGQKKLVPITAIEVRLTKTL